MSVSIHVPAVPPRLRITQTMVDDFLCDPVLGARVIMGVHLDAFQASALRTWWWVPDVIDSSGFGTGKSFRAFIYANLRCILIGDQWGYIYYQTFQTGKAIFWKYYDDFNARTAPIFAAQLGKLDEFGEADGKDNTKGPACFIQRFRNGSEISLPAPGWFQSAKSQAGLTYNFAVIDEWTKVETMAQRAPGSRSKDEMAVGGIDQQVLGRLRRSCWNQFHPLWGNHCKFAATAESYQHPAARRLKNFQREIAKGNPNFAVISYSFKDTSNLPSHTGKPFREQIINWQRIKAMKVALRRSHFLREGLGIWARETSGIYTEESLDNCVAAGVAANVQPEVGRNDSLSFERVAERVSGEGHHLHYFLGGDPAPAQTKKADDGALAVLRVRPKPGLGRPPTANVTDWEAAFVWAYRVRGETRRQEDQGVYLAQTSRQWSGLIHARHRAFNFSGVVLDPQGGGSFVMTELNKTRQLIDGIETEVTPIATLDDLTAGMAAYILTMFRRQDTGVQSLWPILPGDDSLYDAMHMTFQQAIEHGMVLFPKPYNDRDPAEYANWSAEKKWALKNLDAARSQMGNIQAATREDGSWQLTSRGAKTYQAAGKKDLAYACIYAYTRFLIWLKQNELEFSNPDVGDGGAFYVG